MLLFALGGALGTLAVVPLLPAPQLVEAYPRIALMLAAGAVVAALVARGVTTPIAALARTLRDRLQGREVLPAPDPGHDELRELRDSMARFLEVCDERAAPEAPPVTALVQGGRGLQDLLDLAGRLPGPGGARGALERCLAGVREALRLEHASLLLLDEPSGRLCLHLGAGLPDELLAEVERHGPRPVRFAAGVGVAGAAIENGRTEVALRGARDRNFASLGGEHEARIRSLCCAPLRVDGRVVGVLNAVNTARAAGFDAQAVDFVERAARLAEGWVPDLIAGPRDAEADPLTGALPFEAWEARLGAEVDRHRRRPRGLSVAVFELAFPEGEVSGPRLNQALREAGELLRKDFRRLDSLGREGNRFFLCLPETDVVGALHMVGRMKEQVDLAALGELGEPPRFAAVAGVATVPETLEDPDRLVAAAEDALLRAQRAGDHRVACFDPRIH